VHINKKSKGSSVDRCALRNKDGQIALLENGQPFFGFRTLTGRNRSAFKGRLYRNRARTIGKQHDGVLGWTYLSLDRFLQFV
jgi:hypothetical protein